MVTDRLPEPFAQRILGAALAEDRCAELLDCLFEGGSATVDPTGKLALATAGQLRQLCGDEDPDERFYIARLGEAWEVRDSTRRGLAVDAYTERDTAERVADALNQAHAELPEMVGQDYGAVR